LHYYKLNISDWIADLSYLSPLEEGVYLRLINHYYDKELPIPQDFENVARKLRLSEYTTEINLILSDFFVLTDKGWENKRCNENIKEFRKTSNKNKKNGAKGGRPAKTKACKETQKEPSGLIMETQQEPKHNPNHKPITNNHKPIKEKIKRKAFVKPKENEINKFAFDEKINLSGYFDFYESNGWKVGKNPMKDWKAAARGWSKRRPNFSNQQDQNFSDDDLTWRDKNSGIII